jgi:hypothetical protein
MKKLIIGLVAGMCMTYAHAWGDREQGALAGIIGTILWQKLDQQNQQPQPPAVIYRTPQHPHPVIIQETVVPRVQQCTAWREILQHDGSVVRERTCYQR